MSVSAGQCWLGEESDSDAGLDLIVTEGHHKYLSQWEILSGV